MKKYIQVEAVFEIENDYTKHDKPKELDLYALVEETMMNLSHISGAELSGNVSIVHVTRLGTELRPRSKHLLCCPKKETYIGGLEHMGADLSDKVKDTLYAGRELTRMMAVVKSLVDDNVEFAVGTDGSIHVFKV